MKPSTLVFAALLMFTLSAYTQVVEKEQFSEIQEKLQLEKDQAKKAALLYRAANYYLDREGAGKKQLDSASLLNSQSLRISRTLKLKTGIAQSMLLDGKIAMTKGDNNLAARLKRKALEYALANTLHKEAAEAYISISFSLKPEDTATTAQCYKKAASHYRQGGLPYDEAETFTNLAVFYNNIDKPTISIRYAKQAIKLKKGIRRYDFFKEYATLALNLRVQGNYKDALAYALAAEKTAESGNADQQWLSVIYDLLGTINSELHFDAKSTEYFKKAIALAQDMGDADAVRYITLNTARGLYSRGNDIEALNILKSESSYFADRDCDAGYYSINILLYCRLKRYDKARPYYEKLLKCDNENDINNNHIAHEVMYYSMIHYLIKTGQAGKAYTYIDKLRQLAKLNNDPLNLAQLEKNHFEVDSANGNCVGAMEHFKKHKSLNDSLYNIKSAKQFANLQLKYDTEKKDKNIKLLTEHGRLQEQKIRNANILRYVFIVGLTLLALFVGLLYNRARLKQRINKKLEVKQMEIDSQNEELKELLSEKEGLLREKEWLLKEIHHRVKNNLQIIISLLNTQSAYLDNEDALMAIQNSQHRMHAMSLIHQKLYQSDNLATIDISWYIHELVNYLQECFTGPDLNINYTLDTEQVELDVSQAVPLGLIINEAVSNAIKYAFEGRDSGEICISLKSQGSDNYRLVIADDGPGLPQGFEMQERESLGMNLMIGLADQLDGTIEMDSTRGLSIIVTFARKEQLAHTREVAEYSI